MFLFLFSVQQRIDVLDTCFSMLAWSFGRMFFLQLTVSQRVINTLISENVLDENTDQCIFHIIQGDLKWAERASLLQEMSFCILSKCLKIMRSLRKDVFQHYVFICWVFKKFDFIEVTASIKNKHFISSRQCRGTRPSWLCLGILSFEAIIRCISAKTCKDCETVP